MAELVSTDVYHCTNGNSRKQYILIIEKTGEFYNLTAKWGRIEHPVTSLQSKHYVIAGSLREARERHERMAMEKLGKGYYRVSSAPLFPQTSGQPNTRPLGTGRISQSRQDEFMDAVRGIEAEKTKNAPAPKKKAPPKLNPYAGRRVELPEDP